MVASSGFFHRLCLRRREGLANLLSATRSVQRDLRVLLKLRHHFARDQFVAALRDARIGPVVTEQQAAALGRL